MQVLARVRAAIKQAYLRPGLLSLHSSCSRLIEQPKMGLTMKLTYRYKGRGLFLSAPTIAMADGVWHVFPPESEEGPSEPFNKLFLSEKLASVQHAFEPGRCKGTLAALYETMIVHQLQT